MMYKNASKRLFFIAQLKRARITKSKIVQVYLSIVRPILEYACQVWHAGLTVQQTQLLESIQERALRLAFPSLTYEEALQEANIPTLSSRRDILCKRLFQEAEAPDHKLFPLLPVQKTHAYQHRQPSKYPLPKVHTERFKGSFINYGLFSS